MSVDFQIDLDTLGRYLKSVIAKNIPVFQDPVIIDPTLGPAYITRVDFTNATVYAMAEVDGPFVFLADYLESPDYKVVVGQSQLVVQKVRPNFFLEQVWVSYSTEAQLRAANFNEPASQSIELPPISFVLDAKADYDGTLWIVPELNDVAQLAMLPAAQRQKLQDAVGALKIQIPLGKALGGIGGGVVQMPRFINAGMALATASPLGAFVALRFEYERPDQQRWNNFYQAQMPNVLGDGQWAALLSSDLLTGPLQQMLSDNLQNSPVLTDVSEPVLSWDPAPSGLGVSLVDGSFSAKYINACPGVNLGFTVNITSKAVVAAPNQLGISFTLDVHKNVGDSAACTLEIGFLFPILGIWLGANYGNVGWAGYWGGLAFGPVIDFFTALGMLNSPSLIQNVDLSQYLPQQFSQVGNDPPEYLGIFDLSSIADVLEGMTLTSVVATDWALVLGGTFTVPDVTQGSLVTGLDHDFVGQGWGDQTPCSAPTYTTDAVIKVDIDPRTPIVPVKFAGPFLEDDLYASLPSTLNRYSPYAGNVLLSAPSQWSAGFIKVSLGEADISPDFAANPYPCELLLLSTAGARWMSIPAPPPITYPDPVKQAAWRANNCLLVGSVWGRGVGNGFNPIWNVDGPIEGLDYLRYWGMAISGLRPNDQVSAFKGESLVAQSTANHAGTLQLTLFDTGAAAPVSLKLRADEPRLDAVMQMEQTLLVRIAEMPIVGGRFGTLQFEGGPDQLMLNIESHQGVISYRIRGKGLPTPAPTRPIATRAAATQIASFGKYVARHVAEAGVVHLYQRVETKTFESGMAPVRPEA